jgi:hypothetical protein
MPDTNKPTSNVETILQSAEETPEMALQNLREQMKNQKMSKEDLSRMREGVERSEKLQKQKTELMEAIQQEADAREAEERLDKEAKPEEERAAEKTETVEKKGDKIDAKMPEKTKTETVKGFVNDFSIKTTETVFGLVGKDISQWSDEKKRNVGLAITLGVTAVVGALAWTWARGKNAAAAGREAAEARGGGWFKKLAIALGIGGLAFLGYQGYKLNKKHDSLASAYEDLKNQGKNMVDSGKDALKSIIRGPGEKYKLKEDQYQEAERTYRRTRGTDKKDIQKIREIFGLKDGETSKEYEEFTQEMSKKYETKNEKGVTYAKTEVALHNYEESMKVALNELLHWITNHGAEIGLIALTLQGTGLVNIRTILQGTATVAVKSALVAKEMAKMAIKHPLLSLFTVGGSLLAMKATLSATKDCFIPENFRELAKACTGDADLILGDVTESVNAGMMSLRTDAVELASIGENFGTWVGNAITSFGMTVLEKAPETLAQTKEEISVERNANALDSLRHRLENDKTNAATSSDRAKDQAVPKYEVALEKLGIYQSVLTKERLEKVTTSDAPQEALAELRRALEEVGITLEVKDGIVYWKQPDDTLTDLSVDPTVKDKEKIYALSSRMRQGEEGDGTYVWYRALSHWRERQQRNMDRIPGMETIPGGKVLAMVIGNVIYFTDPENHKSGFWTAPASLGIELFGDKPWAEKFGDVGVATTESVMMSLSAATLAKVKRAAIGGGKLFSYNEWSIGNAAKGIIKMNPFTAPLNVLQDVSRGVIDFDTFMKIRLFKTTDGTALKGGGRFANILLGHAGIRPEWIGIVETTKNEAELRRIGSMIPEVAKGNLQGKKLEEIRKVVKEAILKQLKETKIIDKEFLKYMETGSYDDVYNAAKEWYGTRSWLSRQAERVSTGLELRSHIRNPLARGRSSSGVQAVAETADATAGAAKGTAEVVKAGAKEFKTFDELKDAIDAAKAAKNNKELATLMKNPLLREAANEGNKAARALLRVQRLLTGAKWAGRGLSFLGVLIDAAMIYENEGAISEAQKTGNVGMQQTLESKRLVIGGQAGVGLLGMLALSGPQALAVAPFYIGTSVYTSKIYDAVVDWEKSSNDWLKQSPDELKNSLDAIPYGHTNMGHRAALGDSVVSYAWKRLPIVGRSDKKLEQEEEDQSNSVEAINRNTRREILTAYFIKTMQAAQIPGETDAQFVQRMATPVRDRLAYINRMTGGTYIIQVPQFYEQAGSYADLMDMRRSLDKEKAPLVLDYEFDGYQKSLDLGPLAYVFKGGTDNRNESMSLMKTLRQYETEVKPQIEAMQDLRTVDMNAVPDRKAA